MNSDLRQRALELLNRSGTVLQPSELENMEVAELGLGDFEKQGLFLIVYVNNERYCAKELILLPRQTCPQHRHPPTEHGEGKMETFRCRWGKVWLYVEGQNESGDVGASSAAVQATVPQKSAEYYTVFHEIELGPGDQYTIAPDTWHWFQAGDEGAVVSEFSSPSHDEFDVFTDPNVQRVAAE